MPEGVENPQEDPDGQAPSSGHTNTRRQFIAGSAGALGVVAAGGAIGGSVLAQDDDGEDDDGEETEAEPEFEDDVAILNYALTLEYLEARFYQQGLDTIGEDALCNCDALSEDSYLQEQAYEELRTIQEHEESHVETLVSTIEDLGGTPIEEPAFDFGLAVEYPMAFLGTAAQLESIGVSAYAGAAPYIENEDLIPTALGIHSVEARHASFLQSLNARTGFPDVVDQPRTRAEVLELAGGFIVSEDDTETPGNETETPGEETETPVNETETPGNETETPVNETETPINETETPVNETETPVNETTTPVNETETPVNETTTPVNETTTPGGNQTTGT